MRPLLLCRFLVAACYVGGIGLGRSLRKPKLVQASLTSLLVFAITYLACWVSIGYDRVMDYRPWMLARAELHWLGEALSKHAETSGELPARLQDLPDASGLSRLDSDGRLLDPWGHPYHYRKSADRFELASLGRDGRSGGVGLDADVRLDASVDEAQTRLPISQFLFETAGSRSVFLVALMASV